MSELLRLFLCLLLADDHIAQTDLTDLRDLFCKVRELRERQYVSHTVDAAICMIQALYFVRLHKGHADLTAFRLQTEDIFAFDCVNRRPYHFFADLVGHDLSFFKI